MTHPLRKPEHARLLALAGTYDVQLDFFFGPDRPPVTTPGTSTIRALLGDLFIEETIEGALSGQPFTTLSWTGFNPFTGLYEATRIASTNTIRIAEAGPWDDARQQFELAATYPFAGETWTQRSVIRPGDAMVVESWMSKGGGPEWKGVEIRYTKRTR